MIRLLNTLAPALAALWPALFWLVVLQGRRFRDREAWVWSGSAWVSGMASVFLASYIEMPLRFLGKAQHAFAGPIIEEILKVVVCVIVWRVGRKRWSAPALALVPVAVGLGFAAMENMLYVTAGYLAPQDALQIVDPAFGIKLIWKVYLMRILLTLPGHALWTTLAAGGVYRFLYFDGGRLQLAGFFILGTALHLAYNAMLAYQSLLPGGLFVLVPLTWAAYTSYVGIGDGVQARPAIKPR